MSDDINRLAADLADASLKASVAVRAVVQKGALNVKTDARRLSSGMAHAPHYPRSIGYDTKFTASGVEAEIGPDKSKPQGALGNLLEYGSVNNAPSAHLGPALDIEGPKFVKAIADVAEDLI